MIICYYGDGKGKTTAALGLALRASGYGKNIKIIQFIKGDWKSGEQEAIKKLEDIKLEKFGLGFVGLGKDKHTLKEHSRAAERGLAQAKSDIKSGKYSILILDEILGAVEGGLLEIDDTVKLIKKTQKKTTLVLTGRPKINRIIEISDLVSEIKKVKHPFDRGIPAQRGIDY